MDSLHVETMKKLNAEGKVIAYSASVSLHKNVHSSIWLIFLGCKILEVRLNSDFQLYKPDYNLVELTQPTKTWFGLTNLTV